MQKMLTLREKAVLYALAAGCVETWTDAYIAASNENETITRQRPGLSTMVQRWKSRQDVKDAYLNAQRAIVEKESDAIRRHKEEEGGTEERTTGEGERTTTTTSPGRRTTVDYTDPKNQARKLNELVNKADNTGEALDALKVIIQSQKADRDAARDGKQVRAYVPITCDACPLYEKARKRVTI